MAGFIARHRVACIATSLVVVFAVSALLLGGPDVGLIALIVVGGGLATLTCVPPLTCGLLALFLAPTFLLLRWRGRLRVATILLLGLVALLPTSLVAYWVHGEFFASSVYCEVPVEITFEPSAEAFAAIPDDFRYPFAAWNWNTTGELRAADGRILYPLFETRAQGIEPWREWGRWRASGEDANGRFARASAPQPFTVALRVSRPMKYVGALYFRLTSPMACIEVREEPAAPRPGSDAPFSYDPAAPESHPMLFTLPIERGQHTQTVSDRRGHRWTVTTRTSEYRLVRETRHLF